MIKFIYSSWEYPYCNQSFILSKHNCYFLLSVLSPMVLFFSLPLFEIMSRSRPLNSLLLEKFLEGTVLRYP